MHAAIQEHQKDLAAICRRFHVARLEVFGSAARADDFDPTRSDADFLVSFQEEPRHEEFLDLKLALEKALGRSVDLMERPALEASRNHLRRRQILTEVQPVFSA